MASIVRTGTVFLQKSFKRCLSIARESSVAKRRPLKVVVGLSGGVDSSVTALLLQRAGFDVHCCFMRNWDAADEAGAGLENQPCPIEEDYASAKAVASHLGLPLSRVDFTRQYWSDVFEPMLQGYARGHTPNPDTNCNKFIKFGAFRRHALEALDADLVATGHWAQVWPAITDPHGPLPAAHLGAGTVDGGASPQLVGAVDKSKDQSDFLALVQRESLRRVMFPLGSYTKAQARALAAAAGLPTATRKDSTGICFVGNRRMDQFLGSYMKVQPGRFIDITTGKDMGACANPPALTVGQRARLSGKPQPYFVAGVRGVHTGTNEGHNVQGQEAEGAQSGPMVDIVPGQHHPALYTDAAIVRLSEATLCPSWSQQLYRLRNDALVCTVSDVAAWLRSPHAAWLPAASGSDATVPSAPVLYRDRHRQEDLHEGSVTVVPESVWRDACLLMQAQGTGARAGQGRAVGGTGDSSQGDLPVVVVKFHRPHRAVAPGQVLVLYAPHAQPGGPASTPHTLECGPWTVQPVPASGSDNASGPQGTAWNGAGKPVLLAGPIEERGPSWWHQGCPSSLLEMPLHLRHEGTGTRASLQAHAAAAQAAR